MMRKTLAFLLAAWLGAVGTAAAADPVSDAVSARFLRIAIFVDDLDPTVAFFTDVLGYTVASRSEQTDSQPNNALGLPAGTKRRLVMMKSDGGAGLAIMETKHPNLPRLARPANAGNAVGDIMMLHLVKDIAELHRRAEAKGYKVLQAPSPSATGISKQIFIQGPQGIRVEAHEYNDPKRPITE